ncbi:MAG TPA: hypothetical protein VNZ48_06850 [Xanthobacteraceae bacterium]|nr:hypothetical protein [Xanthobacteraceae bacterium]
MSFFTRRDSCQKLSAIGDIEGAACANGISGGAATPMSCAAKIDLTYMGGIERGRRNPSLPVTARIAKALSVPLPKLLSD